MALPNVLIIGAMKSGTTGLYMDLVTHPDVFMAQDKEPQCLCSDDVLTETGRRNYAQLYAGAHEGQLILDASTDYAKRPEYDGVHERAQQVLPEGFKVIYLVRHPIDRIMSQHRHEFSEGLVSEEVNNEVRWNSRYLDLSSYAYQLEPWLEAVGRDRILVVRFEDYKARRREVVEEVCEFLDLEPAGCQIETDKIYNKSAGKPIRNSFWKAVSQNLFYRNVLRKLLSPKLRMAICQRILPSASVEPSRPTSRTVESLRESLVNEVRRLSEMLGLDYPLWADLANVDTVGTAPDFAAAQKRA